MVCAFKEERGKERRGEERGGEEGRGGMFHIWSTLYL